MVVSLYKQSQIEPFGEVGLLMQLVKFQNILVELRRDRPILSQGEYILIREMYLSVLMSIRFLIRRVED